MAILKIIAHGKKREAKRKVLQYVLDPNKTQEGLPFVTGDFQADEITSKTVFQEFQRVRTLFGKDIKGNRTYLHGTLSFPPGEPPLFHCPNVPRITTAIPSFSASASIEIS